MRSTMIAGLAVTLLLLGSPLAGRAQQTDIALVYRLMLDRQMVVAPPETAERQAVLGDRLDNGDAVVTSPNTRAAIRFADDGSLVRLNPNSQLLIRAEGEANALVKALEVEFGELWARVTEQDAGGFEVRTPSGVAAVKGTEFVVRVDVDGTTSVFTFEGLVEFFNDAGTTEIGAGNRAVVRSANEPPEAEPISDEDLSGLAGLLEDEGAPDEERIEVEIQLQGPDGRVRTLILELPRAAANSILGTGS